jgi:hypothetical protein
MMLGEITEEIIELYNSVMSSDVPILRDALRDQLAARLKAEFDIHFDDSTEEDHQACKNWTDAQWQEQADKILLGEK